MRVLFFAPHSAIWIHAFPEALVADALAQQGHQIIYVGCGGLLASHCISMTARGVSFEAEGSEKARICRSCRRNRLIIRSRFNFSGEDLSDSVEDEDWRIADAFASSVQQEDCLELVVEGVEVGRIALYELLIQNKKAEVAFSEEEWRRYLSNLRNAICVLRVMTRLLDRERPDRLVVYNALYSVNRIACRLAEIWEIPQYFLHAGDNLSMRLQTLILARGQAFSYYESLREKWLEIYAVPATANAMKSATDHFLEVARGRSMWAYSAAPAGNVDLRSRFGIAREQKIIVATMSSDDERFSGEIIGALTVDTSLLFPRQVDWIKALIRYVAEKKDLFLIIRVHPREFPNKRESVLSEHASMLMAALSDLPENVCVNWPTDNVSLYDLANVADVFANAWSSAGKEMAWLGLPVVLYSHALTLYPATLNYVGTTEQEYFRKLEEAMADGWSPERIRATYRWCAIEYSHAALDISESFQRTEHSSFLARATSKILRTVFVSREQTADCSNRAVSLKSRDRIDQVMRAGMETVLDLDEIDRTVTLAEETTSLKGEVLRLAQGLYGGTESAEEGSLIWKLREFAHA